MEKKTPNIKERILKVAKNQGLSYESFLTKVDLKYANFKGKQKLGGINSNSLERIVSEFPEVDLHWLVTGEEKIEKEKEVMKETNHNGNDYKNKYLEVLEENRELHNENKLLLKSVISLKKHSNEVSD